MLSFAWDEAKNRRNISKHGVAFRDAVLVFQDVGRIDLIDDSEDYGEERMIIIGMVGQQLLHVVYVERPPYIRVISARKAEKGEADAYFTGQAD
jgi:uncharacterized protein